MRPCSIDCCVFLLRRAAPRGLEAPSENKGMMMGKRAGVGIENSVGEFEGRRFGKGGGEECWGRVRRGNRN